MKKKLLDLLAVAVLICYESLLISVFFGIDFLCALLGTIVMSASLVVGEFLGRAA